MMRWILRLLTLIALLLGGWFYFGAAHIAPLLAYRTPPEVVVGTDGTVDANTKRAFDALGPDGKRALLFDFPKSAFFAAFAGSADGRYGWVSGRHNPSSAQVGALSRCGDGCRILVELRPKGYDPDRRGLSVSETAARGSIAEGAVIYYALAANGVWTVQRPIDGTAFPQWSVMSRCRELLGDSPTTGSKCTLFYGPVRIIAP
jgi:hypothetical protein